MLSKPPIKNLWGRGPAKMEPLLTLQSEGSVRFEQFGDADPDLEKFGICRRFEVGLGANVLKDRVKTISKSGAEMAF